MESAPLSRASNQSRACVNCSKSKAKCIPQANGESNECARCVRLKKECVVLPRTTRKKRTVTSNAAQLEQKIETLVNLLSVAQGPSKSLQPPENEGAVNIPGDIPWDELVGKSKDCFYVRTSVVPSPKSTQGQSSTTYASPILSGDQPTSADRLLQIFLERYAIHLPYFVIAPNTIAHELRERQPWLYRTVLLVATSEDRNKQIELGMQIVTEISSAMITRGERSLDMLQALLIYNSWSYYVAAGSPQSQSTALPQLAIALLFDLCLNRPAREDWNDPTALMTDLSRWNCESNTKDKNRSVDERRALLYCFYMSSVSSLCMNKFGGMPSTPYIEHSCQSLQEEAEVETDLVLVACARLQSIIDSINRNRIRTNPEPRAPAWMHTPSLRSDLQNVLKPLSPSLQSNYLIRMTYHSAEIFLYESSIYNSFSPNFSSQRIDMLYSCLLAAKSLLEVFIAQPLTSFYGFAVANLSQIGHACSTLFKLSLVEEVGWDLAQIRQTVNLGGYLDQIISNFEQAGAAIDASQRAPCRESFPTGCARAMTKVRNWYEAKVTPESEVEGPPNVLGADYTMEGLNWNGFDYLDDAYWQEIIGDMTFMQQ